MNCALSDKADILPKCSLHVFALDRPQFGVNLVVNLQFDWRLVALQQTIHQRIDGDQNKTLRGRAAQEAKMEQVFHFEVCVHDKGFLQVSQKPNRESVFINRLHSVAEVICTLLEHKRPHPAERFKRDAELPSNLAAHHQSEDFTRRELPPAHFAFTSAGKSTL